jgi:hypothetical protein
MKNSQCLITFTTKGGSIQTIRKYPSGWVMLSGAGNSYKMTAEQVLSHLLPALAKDGRVSVKVEFVQGALAPAVPPKSD